MKKEIQHTSDYLTLTNLIASINRRYGLLTQNEVVILDMVCKENLANRLPFVFEIMLFENVASQATIHAVIKLLIKKNFLTTETDPKDNRRKFVSVTNLALKRLQECNHAIKKICKE